MNKVQVKGILFVVLTLFFFGPIVAQSLPSITPSDYITKANLGTKPGWCREYMSQNWEVMRDTNFATYATYWHYVFYTQKGRKSYLYPNFGYIASDLTLEHLHADSLNSKRLTGTFIYYNKEELKREVMKYKDGFLIKYIQYSWDKKHIKSVGNQLYEIAEYAYKDGKIIMHVMDYTLKGKIIRNDIVTDDGIKVEVQKTDIVLHPGY